MTGGGWTLASVKPLAFGGWAFTISGETEKHLEWWPGDRHLMWMSRPFLPAPVAKDTGKSARAAAEALVALLNDEEAA